MAAKASTKKAAVEEDDELEEIDDEVEAPAKGTKAKKVKEPKAPSFGTAQLIEHIKTETDKDYDGKSLRILLRKLAKDGVIERTVGEDKSRYSFSGPDDEAVEKIVEAIQNGEAEKAKAAKIAEAKKTAAKSTKAKGKAAEEDDDEEELED